LPDQVTCQSVSGGLTCADPLIWNVGNLAPNNGTATLFIDVTVNPDAGGQSIVNSISVTATNVFTPVTEPEVCPDGSLPNPDGSCPNKPLGAAELLLNKTAEDLNGPPLVISDTIRYTVQVTNTGTFTAYNVTVTDDLPDQVTCQSVSGGLTCADPLVWDVGDLEPNNGTATLFIEVMIKPDAAGQSIVNSVSVTATNTVNPIPVSEVCPDGSPPNPDGSCPNTPGTGEEEPTDLFLPVILKRN